MQGDGNAFMYGTLMMVCPADRVWHDQPLTSCSCMLNQVCGSVHSEAEGCLSQGKAIDKALGPDKDQEAVSMAATWEDGAKVCAELSRTLV